MRMPEEQLRLIEVGDEVKELLEPARQYRNTVSRRLKLQKKEADQKAELIAKVKAADLKPIKEDGKQVVRFKYEDVVVEFVHEEKDNVKVTIEE